MSKAFTREDDDVPVPPPRRLGVPVPVPNPITAAGLCAIRSELARTESDDRARELGEHLATAEEVAPTPGVVGFGARVTLSDGRTFHLVGAIEANPKEGAIHWQSPIATALYGARVGDEVTLPRGEVEVVAIDY